MYHCFRLRRGQDLYEEIEAYVKAHHIAAGAVVSGVGCVSRWRLRAATFTPASAGRTSPPSAVTCCRDAR